MVVRFLETVSVLASYSEIIFETFKAALGSKGDLYPWRLVSFLLFLPNEGEKSWRDTIDLLRERLKSPLMCDDIPASVDVISASRLLNWVSLAPGVLVTIEKPCG